MSKVTKDDYPKFMAIAREEAEASMAEGGEPIGACVVHLPTGKVLGRGRNQRIQLGSRILHAETDAIDNMTMTGEPGGPPVPNKMVRECGMVTTMSPCPMCAGAVIQFGMRLVVMAENVTAPGGEKILADHAVEVVNMKDMGCVAMIWDNPDLATPFKRQRNK